MGGTFLCIVALFIFYIGSPSTPQSSLQRLSFPLWSERNSVSTVFNVFAESLKGNKKLAEDNMKLRSELEAGSFFSLQNRMLMDENHALRILLGKSRFSSLVLAPVLRTPPGTFYDTILIDVGNEAEIVEGNRVVVNGSIVIGTISKVSGRVGTVVLFSTEGIETEVLIGTSTARVVAVGRGGGNFVAEVPRDLALNNEDLITLPGSPTLLFAVVEKIESNPADPFQSIFFQNPVNVSTLSFVQVLTNNEEGPKELQIDTETEVKPKETDEVNNAFDEI